MDVNKRCCSRSLALVRSLARSLARRRPPSSPPVARRFESWETNGQARRLPSHVTDGSVSPQQTEAASWARCPGRVAWRAERERGKECVLWCASERGAGGTRTNRCVCVCVCSEAYRGVGGEVRLAARGREEKGFVEREKRRRFVGVGPSSDLYDCVSRAAARPLLLHHNTLTIDPSPCQASRPSTTALGDADREKPTPIIMVDGACLR